MTSKWPFKGNAQRECPRSVNIWLGVEAHIYIPSYMERQIRRNFRMDMEALKKIGSWSRMSRAKTQIPISILKITKPKKGWMEVEA
jgi:hypothetical protein